MGASLRIQIAVDTPIESGEQDPLVQELRRIRTGVDYLIFGEKVMKSQRGGLQQYGDLYNIVGNSNGIFIIDGDTATPLGPVVPMTTASPAPAIPHTYSVKALMAVRIDE